jgi:hypothetical protein
MKKHTRVPLGLYLLLLVFPVFLLLNACSKDEDNGAIEDTSITSGKWVGQAEFGFFDIIVNTDGTYITEITYRFSDWSCGGVVRSGNIKVSSDPGWSISNRSFTILRDMDPDPFNSEMLTITGSFKNKNSGSGTWQASSACSGTWTASPE